MASYVVVEVCKLLYVPISQYTPVTLILMLLFFHSLQTTVYSLQPTVYSLQSTVYSLQSTVYSLQSTVYSLQSSSIISMKVSMPSSVPEAQWGDGRQVLLPLGFSLRSIGDKRPILASPTLTPPIPLTFQSNRGEEELNSSGTHQTKMFLCWHYLASLNQEIPVFSYRQQYKISSRDKCMKRS